MTAALPLPKHIEKKSGGQFGPRNAYKRRHRHLIYYLGMAVCKHCAVPYRIYGKKDTYKAAIKHERSCWTCVRDLSHFKTYGKYPLGSIFWELMLYDPSLR